MYHGKVYAVKTENEIIITNALILATGHSARDVFEQLKEKQISMVC